MIRQGAPRRSCLSVPCTSPEMLAKGLTTPADTVFFDLEDSVPDHLKEMARRNAVEMAAKKGDDVVLGLRINAWTTKWFYRDLIDVIERAGKHFDYIVLPKVDQPAEVVALEGLLSQLERNLCLGHTILIEPIIESGAGLLNAREIAGASERVFSMVFAPEGLDFAADMHLYEGVSPGFLDATSVLPLAAARAHGITLIDGPYVALYDFDGLRQTAAARFAMGFDGKWAIHPDQIEVLNEAFTPAASAVARANGVVQAMVDAAGRGSGATVVESRMVDIASERLARVALDRSTLPRAGDAVRSDRRSAVADHRWTGGRGGS